MGRDAPAPPVADERWADALRAVVDDPGLLILHAQPIVELTTGQVAGYELLSRFHGPWSATPDVWFAAAERWGFNAVLQSRVLTAGMAARSDLPPDTFLTVNVDPHLLESPEVSSVLGECADFSRLVLELTEHTRIGNGPATVAALAHVRAAGGLVAMDDAGTGYAGLSTLLNLRPDIVKLDRDLIAGIDRDPVRRALVEVFGDLAGRMDSWVLAEGIETDAELDVVIGLGVPLGQGYRLARPAAVMLAQLDTDTVGHIRSAAARTSLRDHIASLIRPASVGTDPTVNEVLLRPDGMASLVRADASRPQDHADRPPDPADRPQADAGRPPQAVVWAPALTVAPGTAPVEAARRAMSREAAHRFAPLVCTDAQGTVLGVVAVDDLVISLCASSRPAGGR